MIAIEQNMSENNCRFITQMNITSKDNVFIDAFIFALEDMFVKHSDVIRKRQIMKGNFPKVCQMKLFKKVNFGNLKHSKSNNRCVNNNQNIFDKVFESPVNIKKQ